MLVQLIKFRKSIPAEKSKDGKAHNFVNLFVQFNGTLIAVRPAFDKDLGRLSMLAEEKTLD